MRMEMALRRDLIYEFLMQVKGERADWLPQKNK